MNFILGMLGFTAVVFFVFLARRPSRPPRSAAAPAAGAAPAAPAAAGAPPHPAVIWYQKPLYWAGIAIGLIALAIVWYMVGTPIVIAIVIAGAIALLSKKLGVGYTLLALTVCAIVGITYPHWGKMGTLVSGKVDAALDGKPLWTSSDKSETVARAGAGIVQATASWGDLKSGDELPINTWSQVHEVPVGCGVSFSQGNGTHYQVQTWFYNGPKEIHKPGTFPTFSHFQFKILDAGKGMTKVPFAFNCPSR